MTSQTKPYTYRIPIEKIQTAKSVIDTLVVLESRLAPSELLQVVFFNRAYLIITKQIDLAKTNGLFDNPELMEEMEVAFAIRYFQALNNYVKYGVLPDPWAHINQGWLHKRHPASLSLLLGANAHINYDLPLALKDVIRKPKGFQNDYFRVNKLLRDSSKAISKSYYESEKTINFLKKNLRALYLHPVMWLILYWRTRAWQKLHLA